MALVFVIEDDNALLKELCTLLTLEGFEWRACKDFANAAQELLDAEPDCAIVDAMLPGTDGRVIVRQVRAASDVPIIMLTCLDTEFDEVCAMNQGADDYLTKPYRPAVLVAHIRAALRRKGSTARQVLSHGGVTLDVASGKVSFAGSSSELTRNESRILAMLMRAPGTVISRQEIMCDLWESDAFVDDNTLTVNVNRLRKTLQAIGAPDDYVKTKRGEGYRV